MRAKSCSGALALWPWRQFSHALAGRGLASQLSLVGFITAQEVELCATILDQAAEAESLDDSSDSQVVSRWVSTALISESDTLLLHPKHLRPPVGGPAVTARCLLSQC